MSQRLKGKIAVVTGAGSGIGEATARLMAREGAVVVLAGRAAPAAQSVAQDIAAQGGTAEVREVDVGDAAAMRQMIEAVAQRHGRLDVLVNNAGYGIAANVVDTDEDDWARLMRVNVDGVFHGCKYGAEVLRDGGRIVNIASVAGLVGFHGQANYAASKAGVIGLTRVLAKELARRGITVNAVAPGMIQTAMAAEVKPEVLAEYVKQIPSGRLGQPADVANAVLFLASEESGYITGQVLPVTGGWV